MGIYRLLSQWKEKVDGTLTGPSLETDSATVNGTTTTDTLEANSYINGRTSETLIDQDVALNATGMQADDDPSDTTSSTFTTISTLTGCIPANSIPDGATLYGHFFVADIDVPSGETATYLPTVSRLSLSGGFTYVNLTELEVTASDSDISTQSGWVEITSFDPNNNVMFNGYNLQAKVTGGTLTTGDKSRVGVIFEWRTN